MKNDINTLYLMPDAVLSEVMHNLEFLITKEDGSDQETPVSTETQQQNTLIANASAWTLLLSILAPSLIGSSSYYCKDETTFLKRVMDFLQPRSTISNSEYFCNGFRSTNLYTPDADSLPGAIATAYRDLFVFLAVLNFVNFGVFYLNSKSKQSHVSKLPNYFEDVLSDARVLFNTDPPAVPLNILKYMDLHRLQHYGKYGKYYEFIFTALQAICISLLAHARSDIDIEPDTELYAVNDEHGLSPYDVVLLSSFRKKMQTCMNLISEQELDIGIVENGARAKVLRSVSQYAHMHFFLWKKTEVFLDKLSNIDMQAAPELISKISEVYNHNTRPLSTMLDIFSLIESDDEFARIRFKDGTNWLHNLVNLELQPNLGGYLLNIIKRVLDLKVSPYELDAQHKTTFAYLPQKSRVNFDTLFRPGIAPDFIGVDENIEILNNAFVAVAQQAAGAPHFILLSGPPGTGKTKLINRIIKDNGFAYMAIEKATTKDMWLSQLQARLIKVFTDMHKYVKEHNTPVCILVEEFDTACPELVGVAQRGSFNPDDINAVFQTEIDGLEGTKIILVGATNFPNRIVEAVRDRVHIEVLFSLPNNMQRSQILQDTLRLYQISDATMFSKLAAATSSWSPRQIVTFVDNIKAEANRDRSTNIATTQIVHCFNREREKLKISCLTKYNVDMEPQKLEIGSEQAFSGVAIDPSILKKFKAIMNQLQNPELFSNIVRPGVVLKSRHLLLSGPPGTGKSTIAKDLATNINVIFVKIAGGEYKTTHDIIKLVKIRDYLKQLDKAVVFIDEIDAITKTNSPAVDLLKQFITDHEDRFVFIGATNYPDEIDDAILNRFELVEFSLPNLEQRLAVFVHYINNINRVNFSADLRENLNLLYDNLARESEGLAQRDIEKIVNNIIHEIVYRKGSEDFIAVEADDFMAELRNFKPKKRLTCS